MNRWSAAALVPVLVAFDQVTKHLVETGLPLQQPVPVMPFLSMFRTYNTGIAFSFLSGLDDMALVALTLAISAFIVFLWYRSDARQLWARIGYAFVLGGALGNLIDRVRLGHVVDFILVHTQSWSFAVFNLADSFITVGAMLIILDEFLEARRARGEAGKA
jgi:signal peptidase II